MDSQAGVAKEVNGNHLNQDTTNTVSQPAIGNNNGVEKQFNQGVDTQAIAAAEAIMVAIGHRSDSARNSWHDMVIEEEQHATCDDLEQNFSVGNATMCGNELGGIETKMVLVEETLQVGEHVPPKHA